MRQSRSARSVELTQKNSIQGKLRDQMSNLIDLFRSVETYLHKGLSQKEAIAELSKYESDR